MTYSATKPLLLACCFAFAATGHCFADTVAPKYDGTENDRRPECSAERPSKDGADNSLTEKLDECGSVLSPPESRDHEIVIPAPDAGRTPVIPPKALPQTPPEDEKNGD